MTAQQIYFFSALAFGKALCLKGKWMLLIQGSSSRASFHPLKPKLRKERLYFFSFSFSLLLHFAWWPMKQVWWNCEDFQLFCPANVKINSLLFFFSPGVSYPLRINAENSLEIPLDNFLCELKIYKNSRFISHQFIGSFKSKDSKEWQKKKKKIRRLLWIFV